MNVAGILVQTSPAREQEVRGGIERLPGAEVHAISAAGRVVVTVENESDEQMLRVIESLHRIPGVYSVTLVYHHQETDDNLHGARKECRQ